MRAILIRLPNWLGDALMARPALHAVRASFPEARIMALAPGWAGLLDRERLWDERGEATASPPGTFDDTLILPPSFSSAWRLRHPRFGRRVGVAAGGRGPLLAEALPRVARGARHLVDEFLALAARLGARPQPVPPLAPVPGEWPGAAGLDPDAAFAVLSPGARYGPAKRWPAPAFAELARRLGARGWRVLVCGDAGDREVCDAVARDAGPAATSLAGRTSLAQQLALCAAARVTVSNDSGLAHLAAASGAPAVVLFGSTASAWTAPRGPRVRVVQRAPVCAPCFRRTCGIGYRCLTAIQVGDVLAAVAGVTA